MALYVALLAGLGIAIRWVTEVTWRLVNGADVEAHGIRAIELASRASAGIGVLTAVAATALSTALVVLVVRQLWPAQWSCGGLAGFGLVRPERKRSYLSAVVFGVAALAFGGVITGIITILIPDARDIHQDMKALAVESPAGLRVLMALMAITMAPFVEELLLRGVLLSALAARMHVRLAIIITAVIFAALHLPGVDFAWYPLPQFILLGLVLGWLRVHTGSLWPAVAMHATVNGTVLLLSFVSLLRSGTG